MTIGTQRTFVMVPLLMFGLMAGFFYAFSVCVMAGLDLIDPSRAISAMQGINVAVRNPVFFVTFFLTPAIGAIGAVACFRAGSRWSAASMAVAVLCYILGVLLPTTLVNVPMNNALAVLVEPHAAEAPKIWAEYTAPWTAWNTIRTVACTISLFFAGVAATVSDHNNIRVLQ